MQELTPHAKLTITGIAIELFWSIGMSFLGVLGYFVRNWRMLQLVLLIPNVITLIMFCWVPESPKWYLTVNKPDLALKEITKIAKRNGNKIVVPDIATSVPAKKQDKAKSNQDTSIRNILASRILLKHLAVMFLMYFTVNWTYYALLLNIANLSGGKSVLD